MHISCVFVGLDVHKKTIQMSVMDKNGEELLNKKIANTPEDIRYNISMLSSPLI